MAGIYIHYPFCRKKCAYCNFYSLASEKLAKGFIPALKQEIINRTDYLDNAPVQSIYFGGGTPSLLPIAEIQDIIDLISVRFRLEDNAEITLEVNPEDVNPRFVDDITKSKINRFSIGVQSFQDSELIYLDRIHDAAKSMDAIVLLKNAGFMNISCDLIYGLPVSSDGQWQSNIHRLLELEIPHISAYALTVEEKTPLYNRIKSGEIKGPSDEMVTRQFRFLVDTLEAYHYIHYEISNFARKGFYSRHNSLYWLGGHYAGFGPSAHSYNGLSRQWNIRNIAAYISSCGNIETLMEEKEILTVNEKYNEYLLTSLRTVWGCDIEHIRNVFGKEYEEDFLKKIQSLNEGNYFIVNENVYSLNTKGKLFADGITARLFI